MSTGRLQNFYDDRKIYTGITFEHTTRCNDIDRRSIATTSTQTKPELRIIIIHFLVLCFRDDSTNEYINADGWTLDSCKFQTRTALQIIHPMQTAGGALARQIAAAAVNFRDGGHTQRSDGAEGSDCQAISKPFRQSKRASPETFSFQFIGLGNQPFHKLMWTEGGRANSIHQNS